MLNAGQLDQRITLQSKVAGVDSLGQDSTTWADVATVWAQAQPIRGREFFAAGQTQSEVSVRFRIRYRSDVTEQMRVLWRSVAHDIEAVIQTNGDKTGIELMCLSGTKDGGQPTGD